MEVKTTKFLDEFLAEVEGIDPELFPANEEVGKEETPIGKMPLFAQKLMAVAMMYAREVERTAVEVKYASDPSVKASLESVLLRQAAKNRLAGEMAFASLREEFGLFGNRHVGIRKGWIFVSKPCDTGCLEGLTEGLKARVINLKDFLGLLGGEGE